MHQISTRQTAQGESIQLHNKSIVRRSEVNVKMGATKPYALELELALVYTAT